MKFRKLSQDISSSFEWQYLDILALGFGFLTLPYRKSTWSVSRYWSSTTGIKLFFKI